MTPMIADSARSRPTWSSLHDQGGAIITCTNEIKCKVLIPFDSGAGVCAMVDCWDDRALDEARPGLVLRRGPFTSSDAKGSAWRVPCQQLAAVRSSTVSLPVMAIHCATIHCVCVAKVDDKITTDADQDGKEDTLEKPKLPTKAN